MISIFTITAAVVGCAILQQPLISCIPYATTEKQEEVETPRIPQKTEEAIDVALTAEAALVWDVQTNTILYDRNGNTKRPIASLNKLVSSLAVRELLPSDKIVEIPPEVKKIQAQGANIKLIAGQHASVRELLAASLIPSANDAMVTLAIAAKGSESQFVEYTNAFAARHGLFTTKLANATGLQLGGEQYSTAHDVMKMLTLAYADPELKPYLNQQRGQLTTREGTTRTYLSTDELLGTYLTILAGKTGYTLAAKENLAIITVTPKGQRIGAVILGSDNRFTDTKIVVEYVVRNYTWP